MPHETQDSERLRSSIPIWKLPHTSANKSIYLEACKSELFLNRNVGFLKFIYFLTLKFQFFMLNLLT